MRCRNCQHLNPDQSVACSRCGAFLQAPPGSAGIAGTFQPGMTLLDRYSIERVLGAGGMGTVYQVLDGKLGRRAALKVLGTNLLENWKAHERLKREATALARIRHPNVVQVNNVLELQGALAIELELVTGGTVASRIAAGSFEVAEAVELLIQVLEGLEVIHQAGLIHRDIKPGNVLLTDDGMPKIADLGIARDPDAQLLTAPGTLLGTPEYMSPEQIRGLEAEPASDLYACGLVLFEMLSGRLPFVVRTEQEALAAHVKQAPDFSLLPPSVPDAVRAVIATALEKQPERRFASAAAMRQALRAALERGPAPRQVAPPDPSQPARLGEYLIHSLLGEGGMGRVYAAEERLSRRPVALKVMRSEVAASEAGRRLFLNEMAVLAQLDHPNIVRSLACAEIDGQLVMALELLRGETLRERLVSQGRASWEGAVHVAFQVANALDCAHSLSTPIVHRDLKPENVMLLPDGTVKVMDFGIAKVLQAVSQTVTLSIGTLQYMSPEQIDAKPVDGRSDLYALGLILYEMLTGSPPFVSASQRELLNQQCTALPPPLPQHVLGMPRGVERLVYQLLEKAPENRPPTARAVRDALEPFVAVAPTYGAPPVAGPSEPRVPVQPSPPREPEPTDLSAGVPDVLPAQSPPRTRRRGIDVHPALAVAIILALSIFAGGATLLLRLATNFVFEQTAAERQ